MAKTYEEIRTKVYDIIGEKTTATVLSLETLVKPLINSVEEQICEWLVKDTLKDTTTKAWDLRFLMKTKWYNLTPQANLTDDATSGDTTLSLPATWLASDWYVFIGGMILWYTGNTGASLTWVTWLDINISASRNSWLVRQAYAIPTSSEDTIVVKDITTWQDIKYIDYRDDRKPSRYFSIYPNNESTNTSFLVFFWTNTETVRLVYQNWYTPLSNSTDESNLPDDNGTEVTARIVAWLCMLDTNYDFQRGQNVMRQWYGNLERMYKKYANINKDYKRKIQTNSYPSY